MQMFIITVIREMASLIKNEADEEIQISAKSTNKFRYQANRAFIIGRIKSIVPKILCGLFELSIIEQLYTDAVRCRSQLLPGRSFPRKKLKSKGRSHFRNKKVFLIEPAFINRLIYLHAILVIYLLPFHMQLFSYYR